MKRLWQVERVNEKFIAKPNEGDKKQRATKTKQNIIYGRLLGFSDRRVQREQVAQDRL